MPEPSAPNGHVSPFIELDRGDWAVLAPRMTAPLTQTEIVELVTLTAELNGRPLGDVMAEVEQLPSVKQLPPGVSFLNTGDAEVFVDLEGEDIPDHFDGNEADLSDLIVETIALGIDPYPRAPGESIDSLGLPQAEAEIHPFAALKKLKQDLDES